MDIARERLVRDNRSTRIGLAEGSLLTVTRPLTETQGPHSILPAYLFAYAWATPPGAVFVWRRESGSRLRVPLGARGWRRTARGTRLIVGRSPGVTGALRRVRGHPWRTARIGPPRGGTARLRVRM